MHISRQIRHRKGVICTALLRTINMNKYVTTWEANTQNSGIKLWDEVGRIRVLHFLMQNAHSAQPNTRRETRPRRRPKQINFNL